MIPAWSVTREGAVAIVVEKIAALAVRMPGVVEQVGRDVDIEPAIAVVVAKGRHNLMHPSCRARRRGPSP